MGSISWYLGYMYGLPEFRSVAKAALKASAVAALNADERPTVSTSELEAMINDEKVQAALDAPFARYADHPLYPDPIARSAVLGMGIVNAQELPHNLESVIALLFVDINLGEEAQRELDALPAELDDIFRGIATGSVSEDEFISWLASHTRPCRR